MVNSNYAGFGTGYIPKGYGFTLQNRGHGFSLENDHPNRVEPGKRPYHTIIPAIVTRIDPTDPKSQRHSLYATMTNMGAFMQPQGHLQVVERKALLLQRRSDDVRSMLGAVGRTPGVDLHLG